MKLQLLDKQGTIIGYEYHEKNEHGIIQIYHQSLRGDFDNTGKNLVREGYYIPHAEKNIMIKLD